MRIKELIEAVASDADLKARYGDFDPEDKPMLPTTHVGGAPAPTLWTAYDVIRNILGRDRVTDDDDELGPGMYYVYQSSEPPKFRDTDDGVGSINLPNLESTAARDVAQAAHEAYHAYVHSKSRGGVVHANEKIINNLAEKWLRKHLSGPALHVGLEQIVGSRISYGPNHIPTQKENFAEEFTNYQGLRPPKNVPGTNLFPGQDIVGKRVYHCTNKLEAIKKSGGLKPRRDATGEREYGRLSTDEHPFIPVIGIWFSVGKPDWVGKHCISFVIEPTDQVYVAYTNTKGLKPNVVLNPIALDRLTVEGQQDVDENFADGRNPQDKGDSKRHGIPKHASLSGLDKIGRGSGRKAQLARWQANMRRGRAK